MSRSAAPSASAATVRDALKTAATAGPFFQLEVRDRAAGWLPIAELDEQTAARLVARTASQLGTDEPRVACSILHQGLAARMWSPVLGAGLIGGTVPDLSSLAISLEPPVRLGVVRPSGWLLTATAELAELSSEVVCAQLGALMNVLPDAPADGLLRGNSASVMIGALAVLVRSRPELSSRADAVARALLDTASLRGSGVLGDTFRRQSCCLYYRVPGGGLCGDCCFTRPPG